MTGAAGEGDSARLRGAYLTRLEAGLRTLPDKPEESVDSTLAALWHAAAGHPRSAAAALAAPLPSLDAEGADRLRILVERRLGGTPLAHLTHRQAFMGLEMVAGPEALIPRRETEIVGRAALERLRSACDQRGHARAIDICTGSGNLAIALAWHEPRARVHGADLSDAAVGLARENARSLGLEGRIDFRSGDLLEPFAGPEFAHSADLVTCNPPYISSAKVEQMPGEIVAHEPRLAFDGGPLGIRIVDRVVREAPPLLRDGGWLAMEVGLGQGRGVRKRIEQRGVYDKVVEIADESGQVRALLARRRPVAEDPRP